ncbi:hypothetical protein LAUMK4_03013 [Mycobacterium persicum]|uniref:Uncharacterized protein n=1 Tax=Mycobacterium persicum TaxID=1487726 RepID=A0ABY6RK05_9MYCO|nr:hypothetical protein LAUMK15_03339 [Mycobacterium persicum]VAZ95047.1 hypothetical protein LAUMK4_03013 [Mycobacterium persicum]
MASLCPSYNQPPFTLLLVPGTMTAMFGVLSGLPIAIAALPLPLYANGS